MPYLGKSVRRWGEKYRSEYPVLKEWEKCHDKNIHLHCLPTSKYNTPAIFLSRYLEPLLQKYILAGKKNFFFLQHNIRKPCAFFDCAFHILQREKQRHGLRLIGIPYATYPPYPYDESIRIGSEKKMSSVLYYYAISRTADVLLCDIGASDSGSSGFSAISATALELGVSVVNINQMYQREMLHKPENVLLGGDAEALQLYYHLKNSIGTQDLSVLHKLLARVRQSYE